MALPTTYSSNIEEDSVDCEAAVSAVDGTHCSICFYQTDHPDCVLEKPETPGQPCHLLFADGKPQYYSDNNQRFNQECNPDTYSNSECLLKGDNCQSASILENYQSRLYRDRDEARRGFACSGHDDSYEMVRNGSSYTQHPDGSRTGDCTMSFGKSPGFKTCSPACQRI